jgi:YVTN family beta-propeller protein
VPELARGQVFAGHRIEGVAGRGGMGVVYRARHLALDHLVALKVISADLAGDEVFRRRFIDESRIAFSMRHPNVVSIHHAGEESGRLFVTMDLIEGTDLRGLIDAELRLSPTVAIPIVSAVASALDAAHARGLVHRDVKPGNVLVERRPGRPEHTYLTDFGLSKHAGGGGLTASGSFVGTLDYVAPEQIRGESVDARTDVYALGCVLWECLAGAAPFAAREGPVAKLYAHVQEAPPELRDAAPGFPEALDATLRRALAKAPGERFDSAGEFATAAAAAAGVEAGVVAGGANGKALRAHGGLRRPGSRTAPTIALGESAPRSRRTRVAIAVGAVAVLVAVAATRILIARGGGTSGEPSGARLAGAPIPVPGTPVAVDAGPANAWAISRHGALSRIDVGRARVAQHFVLPSRPDGIALGLEKLWVTSARAGAVTPVSLLSRVVGRQIQVGGAPRPVLVRAGTVWVGVGGADRVEALAASSGARRTSFDVGSDPSGLALGAGSLWVSNRGDDTLTRIDISSRRVETVPVGKAPEGVAFMEGRAWVANTADGTVTPVDAGSGRAGRPIAVGPRPHGVVAALGSVWVSVGGADEVARIDPAGGAVTERVELPPGSGPAGIAAGSNSIWVANPGAGTVARIAAQ